MTPRPHAGGQARICVAQIGGAHGLRGEVRLKAFTADPMALAQYGPLESEDGGRRIEIAALRPGKDMLIARFSGIDDRDAAEALCNTRLYVPRERLAAAGEDEFYHADLIGIAVSGMDGRALGTVAAVPNFGAGDLLEIAPADGGPSVLLPFTKAMVPVIDVAGGRIVVDAPAGAFEPSELMAGALKPSPLVGEGGEPRRGEPGEGSLSPPAPNARRERPLTRSRASRGPTLPHKGGG